IGVVLHDEYEIDRKLFRDHEASAITGTFDLARVADQMARDANPATAHLADERESVADRDHVRDGHHGLPGHARLVLESAPSTRANASGVVPPSRCGAMNGLDSDPTL